MEVRLKDIAQAVGVRESTVSRVLNNKANPIKISETTRRRILQAAHELGYHPNAAARSLSTRRTGHIGFILSDDIAGGLTNNYFASYLAGVEQVCRRRGYGLNVSLYNLSNVDTFVFPTRVGQRSVDGLVLSGYVESAIVSRFREFGIPCICLGQDTEVEKLVPTIAADDVSGTLQAIEYAASLGHRSILLHHPPKRRGRQVVEQLRQRMRQTPSVRDCQLTVLEPSQGNCDFSAAPELLDYWLAMPKESRATVICGSDQTLVAFLKELDRRNLKCPRDVSLISKGNTLLCEYAVPPLTAIHYDLQRHGELAAEMLVDHLEGKIALDAASSINDFPCRLVIRESVGNISDV